MRVNGCLSLYVGPVMNLRLIYVTYVFVTSHCMPSGWWDSVGGIQTHDVSIFFFISKSLHNSGNNGSVTLQT